MECTVDQMGQSMASENHVVKFLNTYQVFNSLKMMAQKLFAL